MVMATFASMNQADKAVQELEEIGLDEHDLSFITKSKEVRKEHSSDAAADTAEGMASGAITGGALGGLAGLLAGAGVFPALAGLFIGGPIAALLGLTGVAATAVSGAVTGAAAGGLVGALTGLGVSQEQAETYEKVVEEGGVLLGVPASFEQIDDARAILERNGGTNVDEFELKESKLS